MQAGITRCLSQARKNWGRVVANRAFGIYKMGEMMKVWVPIVCMEWRSDILSVHLLLSLHHKIQKMGAIMEEGDKQ